MGWIFYSLGYYDEAFHCLKQSYNTHQQQHTHNITQLQNTEISAKNRLQLSDEKFYIDQYYLKILKLANHFENDMPCLAMDDELDLPIDSDVEIDMLMATTEKRLAFNKMHSIFKKAWQTGKINQQEIDFLNQSSLEYLHVVIYHLDDQYDKKIILLSK